MSYKLQIEIPPIIMLIFSNISEISLLIPNFILTIDFIVRANNQTRVIR